MIITKDCDCESSFSRHLILVKILDDNYTMATETEYKFTYTETWACDKCDKPCNLITPSQEG